MFDSIGTIHHMPDLLYYLVHGAWEVSWTYIGNWCDFALGVIGGWE